MTFSSDAERKAYARGLRMGANIARRRILLYRSPVLDRQDLAAPKEAAEIAKQIARRARAVEKEVERG